MRYAIFSDIHGNLEALEAVLEKLEQEQPDQYICVGDIVGYGADPNECIRRVRAIKDCIVVAGNHDFAAAGILNNNFFNTSAKEAIIWTARQLNNEETEFLRRLKLINQINNLTIVHSNLYVPEMFEYIQTSYDFQLGFSNLETPICFIGHSHIPIIFSFHRGSISFSTEPHMRLDDSAKTFVNVGSVGQPRDDNPQACYAIYEEGNIYIKRTDYDVETAVTKIRQAGLPAILANRLRYGR